MKNPIKIARLTSDGTPVYDCHVFAVEEAEIWEDIHITGDFYCGELAQIQSIFADGAVYINSYCTVGDISGGEGITIGDEVLASDLVSPEDINVGDEVDIGNVCSYSNVSIGDSSETGNIEVWTGDFELGPNETTGRIQVGRP